MEKHDVSQSMENVTELCLRLIEEAVDNDMTYAERAAAIEFAGRLLSLEHAQAEAALLERE